MIETKGKPVGKTLAPVDNFRQILSDAGIAVYATTPNDKGDPYLFLMDMVLASVELLKAENASLRSSASLDREDSQLFDIWRENAIHHPARLEKYLAGAQTSEDIKEGLIRLRRDYHERSKR